MSLRDRRAQEFTDMFLTIGVGSASCGQARRRAGDEQCVGQQADPVSPFLTFTVSLPDHGVALITLAVIGPFRVAALPSAAHCWLLTLIYICEHTGWS